MDQNFLMQIKLAMDSSAVVSGAKTANAAIGGIDNALKGVARNTALADLGQSAVDTGQQLTTRLTLPLGASAVAATKFSNDYRRSFGQIEGLVGLAGDEVDRLSDSTLNLAKSVGRAPQELADAMFVIQSAGIQGAAGMEALEMAAKGSAAGMGSTADVARALTGSLNAYKSSGLTAATATDILAATARAGNFEVSGLAGSLGKVLPIASVLGVPLEEVGGAIAFLTRSGLTAAEAVTQVRAVLNTMLKPSEAASKALDSVGLSMEDVKQTLETEGMVAALEQLYEATGRNDEQFAKLVGSAEATGAAFQLLNASQGDLDATFGAVADNAGVLEDALAGIPDQVRKSDQAMATLKANMIELGNAVAPLVAEIGLRFAQAGSLLIDAFQALPGPIQNFVVGLGAAAAAAGPLLISTGLLIKGFLAFNSVLFKLSLLKLGKDLTAVGTAGGTAIRSLTASFTSFAAGNASLSTAMASSKGAVAAFASTAGAAALKLGLIGGAAIIAYKAYDTFKTKQAEAQANTERFNEALAMVPGTAQYTVAELEKVTDTLQGLGDQSDATSEQLTGVADALQGGLGEDTVSTMRTLGITFEELAGSIAVAEQDLIRLEGANANFQNGMRTGANAGKSWAEVMRTQVNPEAGTLVDTILEHVEAQNMSATEAMVFTRAVIEQAQALKASNQEAQDNAKALIEGSIAAGKYAEGLVSAVEKQNMLADGTVDYVGVADDLLGIFTAFSPELARAQGGMADLADSTGDTAAAFEKSEASIEAFRDSLREAVEEPENLVKSIEELREAAEREIELGMDADEAMDVVADMTNELLGLTEDDWETVLKSDTASFDDSIDEALLKMAQFSDEEITALINGDPAQLNETLIMVGAGLDLYDQTTVEAAIEGDATGLFNTIDAAFSALSAFNNAMNALRIRASQLVTGSVARDEVYLIQSATRVKNAFSDIGGVNITQFASQIAAARSEAEKLGSSAGSASSGARGIGTAAAASADEVEDLAEETSKLAENARKAGMEVEEYEQYLEELDDRMGEVWESTNELAESQLDLASAFSEVESAANKAKDALDSYNGIQKNQIEATSDYYQELENLAEQFNRTEDGNKDFIATLELSEEQGRENTKAAADYFDALQDLAIATAQSTGSLEDSNAAFAEGQRQFVALAREAGLADTDIQMLLETYGQFPDQVISELILESDPFVAGMETAKNLLDEFEGEPYEAYLQAENEAVRDAVAEALVATAELTDKELLTTLSADSNPFDQVITATLLTAAGFEDAEYLATLAADDSDLREKLLASLVDLGVISNYQARSIITAEYGPGSIKLDDFREELVEIQSPVIIEVAINEEAEMAALKASTDEANQKLDDLEAQHFTQVDYTTVLEARQAAAEAELEVATLEKQRTIVIDSNGVVRLKTETEQANDELNQTEAQRAVNIATNAVQDATTRAETLNSVLDRTVATRTPGIGTSSIANAIGIANNLDGELTTATRSRTADINVSVNTGGVEETLNNLARSRSSTITVTTKNIEEFSTVGAPSIAAAAAALRAADGGIFQNGMKSFANGGFNFYNDAHIAGASGKGLIRYAEEETGGEAFVPLADSKRAGSLAIMGQVADMFGYSMVENKGASLNDIYQPRMGIGSSQTGGGNITIDVDLTIHGTPEQDVRALVQSGIEQMSRDVKMIVGAKL